MSVPRVGTYSDATAGTPYTQGVYCTPRHRRPAAAYLSKARSNRHRLCVTRTHSSTHHTQPAALGCPLNWQVQGTCSSSQPAYWGIPAQSCGVLSSRHHHSRRRLRSHLKGAMCRQQGGVTQAALNDDQHAPSPATSVCAPNQPNALWSCCVVCVVLSSCCAVCCVWLACTAAAAAGVDAG